MFAHIDKNKVPTGLLRDYAEASAIILFYSIGEYFQELSIINSRNSIREVLALKNTIVNIIPIKRGLQNIDFVFEKKYFPIS